MKMNRRQQISAAMLAAAILPVHVALADQTKADNTTNLDLGSSWGGTAPSTGDVAIWNGAYNTAGSLSALITPATSVSWLGIQVGTITGTAAGNVSIGVASDTGVLTLGTSGINLSAANKNLSINRNLSTGSNNQVWSLAAGRTLSIEQINTNVTLTGSGNIELNNSGGSGTATFGFLPGASGSIGFTAQAGFSGYTGNWQIDSGTLVETLRNGINAWGTGTINLNGGTVSQWQNFSGTWTNSMVLMGSSTSTIDDHNTSGVRTLKLNGSITGTGNITFADTSGLLNGADGYIVTGNNSFSGAVIINTNTTVRVGGNTGNDTTLSAGLTGTLGDGSATNTITNNGTLIFSHSNALAVSSNLVGAGIFSIGGTSTNQTGTSTQVLTLSGTNTQTGPTNVSSGYVIYTNAAAVSSSSTITIGTFGSVVASGAQTSVTGWLTSGRISNASTGSIALTGNSSENINFSNGGFNSLGISSSVAAATYSGTITPGTGGYRFGGSNAADVLTVSTSLGGANTLNTFGSSTTVLTGSNSYTASSNVAGGTLVIAYPGTLTAYAGGATIASGATLNVSSGTTLTGVGAITSNAGSLLVGGSLTSTGTLLWTVPAGGALNVAAGGLLSVPTFTQQYNTSSFIVNGTMNVSGTSTVSVAAAETISGAGTINTAGLTLANVTTLTSSLAAWNVSGAVSLAASASFIQNAGTVTFSSATANSLIIGNAGIATYNLTGGTLNALNSPVDLTFGGVATGSLLISGTGVANLNGLVLVPSSSSIANLNLSGGRLNLGANGITAGSAGTRNLSLGATTIGALANWSSNQNFNMTGGTTGTIFNTLDASDGVTARTITLSGILSGTGALKLTGPGTLALSGPNTFTGATSDNGTGKLYVNGSLNSSSAVTVASGATLGGTGTIGGSVTLASGSSLEGGQAGAGTLNLSGGLTFSGLANVNLGSPASGAAINDTGSLTASGAANSITINVASLVGTSSGSVYPLLNYAGGSVAGTGFSAFHLAGLPSRATGFLTDTGSQIDLNLTGTDFLVWSGAGNLSNGWDTTTPNWNLNSSGGATTYIDSPSPDAVVFNDSAASGNTTVNLNAVVSPSAVTFNNNTNPYLLTGTGGINGSTGLTMNGTGTVTLATANTFTGLVAINAGITNVQSSTGLGSSTKVTVSNGATLQLQGGISVGNVPLTLNGTGATGQNGALVNTAGSNTYGGPITLGSAATISSDSGNLVLSSTTAISGSGNNLTLTGASNGTISSPIGIGAGGVTVAGTGTWTLAGADTYTGPTNVASGTLVVNATSALSNSLAINLGTAASGLTPIALRTGGGVTLSSPITVSNQSTGGVAVNVTGATTSTISGPMTLNQNLTINNSNTAILPSAFTGGTLLFGGLNISSGITGTGGLTYTGGGVTVMLSGTNLYSGPTVVTGNSLVEYFSSPSTDPNTLLNISAGSRVVVINSFGKFGGFIGSGAFSASTQTTEIESIGFLNDASDNFAGVVSGPLQLTKTGTGTQVFSGPNTFTGSIAINSGTLQAGVATVPGVSGAFGLNMPVTIANTAGATLDLNGFSNSVGSLAGGGSTGGAVTLGSATLTINGTSNGSFGGIVSGTGGVIINKAGSQTFSGSNTYTGGTNVASGILLVTNTVGSATGTGAVTVNTGASIGGSGIIPGPVSVSGTIFTGITNNTLNKSAGVLTIGGGSTLSGSLLEDLINASGASDQLVFASGAPVTLGGTLTVTNPNNIAFAAGQNYDLLNYSGDTVNGSFGTVNVPTLPSTLKWNESALYTTGIISVVTAGPSTLTWNNSASGSGDGVTWDTTQANWINSTSTAAVYNDASNGSTGDVVVFNDTNSGNYTVQISGSVHPTSVTFSNNTGPYTIGGSGGIAGPGSLTLTGINSVTLSGSNSYTGGTNVSTGKLILASAGAFPGNSSNGTALTLGAGAIVQITAHTGGSSYEPIVSSLTNGGLIDITNNAMLIKNASVTTISGEVSAAYNQSNGIWATTGNGLITSSTVSGLTTVGVASVGSDVLVKATYFGDANLDGQVTSADYTLIDNGYLSNGGSTGWHNGDFNYDNVINGSDYTLIDNAFNTQGAQLAAAVATAQIAGATSSVPEPATLGVLTLSAIGLLGRRRRRA